MSSSQYSDNFTFPECWKDDVRMGALFAPIRSKSVNPTDWDSKIKFWTSLIEEWCKFNQCPVIKLSELKIIFSRNGKVPACLEDVVQHLIGTRILVPEETISSSNNSWVLWAVNTIITSPLKWTFNAVKNRIVQQNINSDVTYVHLPVIKYLADELINNVPDDRREKLMKFDDLMKSGVSKETNLAFILNWLEKKRKVALCYDPETPFVRLVKFPKKGSTIVLITEVDKTIYKLKKQKETLESIILKLKSQRDSAVAEARKNLSVKMKALAIRCLRKKVILENKMEKLSVTLDNIEEVLDKIDEAHLNVGIVDCYQSGAEALRKIMKDNNLNEENVTKTIDDLNEALESVKDLEGLHQLLNQEKEEDLEEELNQLLLENFPNTPTNLLSTDKNETEEIQGVKESKEIRKLEKQIATLGV